MTCRLTYQTCLGRSIWFRSCFMRGIGMTSIDIGGEGAVAFQDGAIVLAQQLS
ncbi:MAG: hypothetical protein CM15mP125_4300 [Gammaproteobacteria bacterium]|nr:MAG: hypothetical protein CM15mP125_4300 [Gammaproteobacteria bacterium]